MKKMNIVSVAALVMLSAGPVFAPNVTNYISVCTEPDPSIARVATKYYNALGPDQNPEGLADVPANLGQTSPPMKANATIDEQVILLQSAVEKPTQAVDNFTDPAVVGTNLAAVDINRTSPNGVTNSLAINADSTLQDRIKDVGLAICKNGANLYPDDTNPVGNVGERTASQYSSLALRVQAVGKKLGPPNPFQGNSNETAATAATGDNSLYANVAARQAEVQEVRAANETEDEFYWKLADDTATLAQRIEDVKNGLQEDVGKYVTDGSDDWAATSGDSLAKRAHQVASALVTDDEVRDLNPNPGTGDEDYEPSEYSAARRAALAKNAVQEVRVAGETEEDTPWKLPVEDSTASLAERIDNVADLVQEDVGKYVTGGSDSAWADAEDGSLAKRAYNVQQDLMKDGELAGISSEYSAARRAWKVSGAIIAGGTESLYGEVKARQAEVQTDTEAVAAQGAATDTLADRTTRLQTAVEADGEGGAVAGASLALRLDAINTLVGEKKVVTQEMVGETLGGITFGQDNVGQPFSTDVNGDITVPAALDNADGNNPFAKWNDGENATLAGENRSIYTQLSTLLGQIKNKLDSGVTIDAGTYTVESVQDVFDILS